MFLHPLNVSLLCFSLRRTVWKRWLMTQNVCSSPERRNTRRPLTRLSWSWLQQRATWTDICTSTWRCAPWREAWMFRWRPAGDSSHRVETVTLQRLHLLTTAVRERATTLQPLHPAPGDLDTSSLLHRGAVVKWPPLHPAQVSQNAIHPSNYGNTMFTYCPLHLLRLIGSFSCSLCKSAFSLRRLWVLKLWLHQSLICVCAAVCWCHCPAEGSGLLIEGPRHLGVNGNS